MTVPPSQTELLPVRPGDVLADKYRVERVLGTGGMGFVVAARNINLGKLVALKMMLPAALAMPRAVERFEREARAAVQLKSEHITEVLDIGRLPTGEPYIVMELLDGDDFEGLLQRDRWLHVDDAVDYVLQACEAVSEAHALGVVHRDLKPKNLFLSHRLDGTPIVKVLDFGISKWTAPGSDSHSLTRTSDVFGSPNYMSPEQIRSARDVDGRTDIWSLGVILFELLTGRVPFVAESLPQLCALVLETQAPRVSTLRADVPPGLVAVVARCLEKSCDHRYQTVNELVAALLPFGRVRPQLRASARQSVSPGASTLGISSDPSLTPPASPSGRVQVANGTSTSWVETGETARRSSHRLTLASMLAVGLLLLSGVGWFGWRWNAQRATAHAEHPDAAVVSVPTSEPPLPSASVAVVVTTATPTATAATAATNATTAPSVVARPRGSAGAARAQVDAGVRPVTAPATTAPPQTDPFQPSDRK